MTLLKTPFHFDCSYCNRPTTIQDSNCSEDRVIPTAAGKDTGDVLYVFCTIVCPNQKCQQTTVIVTQWKAELVDGTHWRIDTDEAQPMRRWNLMPRSRARQYATFVPAAIREDYEEAHLIANDSPKASATLARRALQGIMRDFYGAKPARLVDEINEVEAAGKMDAGIAQALHAVRDVGNIGAHMEKDISVIVPVDPGEAEALLGLIEMLIDETYVARDAREQRVKAVMKVASDKKALKATGGAKALSSAPGSPKP